ncbi:GNAT family N-acetyltransferase [Geomicrobium sp. JSM 1781026]|uniref:GNAT family N-acetyltransferase n=1 Tax=unclassified Geomicrobium TaxID=2628951 RepID=UPI000693CD28|nr:GNAT family N-acetyltransferase [Geomicrobium sp. JCM 19037]
MSARFHVRTVVQEEELHSMSQLYDDVWNSSESSTIQERMKLHYEYEGFLGLQVIGPKDELYGFVYGYTSKPGQYYHERLKSNLPSPVYEQWLSSCFELSELVVHPSARRKGVARYLLEHITTVVRHDTAILTTQEANKKARALYEQLGWQTISETFYPSSLLEPYVIMGKNLEEADGVPSI